MFKCTCNREDYIVEAKIIGEDDLKKVQLICKCGKICGQFSLYIWKKINKLINIYI